VSAPKLQVKGVDAAIGALRGRASKTMLTDEIMALTRG
jgi:hypothetical protein